jgi:4-amino-4-deoxy-L-arabinose transferase-like glycosyltransferase
MAKTDRDFINRHRDAIVLIVLFIIAIILYACDLSRNPPGFFIDESSVAFNAYNIARSGHDEFGNAWPLFFRAFGEYKNPVYIYLLAAVFRLTGPGIFIARSLSAAMGVATGAVLGVLGTKISGRRHVGIMVGALALLTPWLFELSRLVMEVALYPLAVALFLFAVWRAATKAVWRAPEIVSLAATLALLTYTYSIGRLLAPLLALGLFFFVSRARWRGLLITLIAYAVTLVPLLVIKSRRPEVLTGRFNYLTYITPQSTAPEVIREFLRHCLANLNLWRLFFIEQSKVNEILHLAGAPAMLFVTALLIIAGVGSIFYRRQFNRWWAFVIYGLIVSVVPASLTREPFHMLRLSPVPVFLIALTIPAFVWLGEQHAALKRTLIFLVAVMALAQGFSFQWQYHASASAPQRLHTFDADYPARILPTALANSDSAPIYLADNPARPGYIQAYWYATLQGIPLAKFVSLGFDKAAPEGSIVITTEGSCPRCRTLAVSEPYTTYIAQGPPRELRRLSDNAFNAQIEVQNPPATLRTGEQIAIRVLVKNTSTTTWLARERSGSSFQVFAGNHWLDGNSHVVINDDGRGPLPIDVPPGESIVIPLVINAPHRAGDYVLEIDMLQEGVSWFGLRGSKTWRGRVTVN